MLWFEDLFSNKVHDSLVLTVSMVMHHAFRRVQVSSKKAFLLDLWLYNNTSTWHFVYIGFANANTNRVCCSLAECYLGSLSCNAAVSSPNFVKWQVRVWFLVFCGKYLLSKCYYWAGITKDWFFIFGKFLFCLKMILLLFTWRF